MSNEKLNSYEERMKSLCSHWNRNIRQFVQDVPIRIFWTESRLIITEHRHRSSRSAISQYRRQEC